MDTKFTHYLIAAIILVFMSGCLKYHHIDGNNHVEQEQRTTSSFNAIKAEGNIEVYVVYDSITSIEVEAETNLFPYIITSVTDDKLVIEKRRHYNIDSHYPIRVYVKAPYIDDVDLDGSGNLEVSKMHTDNFYANLQGSGKMKLDIETDFIHSEIDGSGNMHIQGKSVFADFYINGSGDIKAYLLNTENCKAKINGSGSIYTSVENQLNVKINGSGNLNYKGKPMLELEINGSGKIINQN